MLQDAELLIGHRSLNDPGRRSPARAGRAAVGVATTFAGAVRTAGPRPDVAPHGEYAPLSPVTWDPAGAGIC